MRAMQGLAFNLQQGNVKALEPGGEKTVDLDAGSAPGKPWTPSIRWRSPSSAMP